MTKSRVYRHAETGAVGAFDPALAAIFPELVEVDPAELDECGPCNAAPAEEAVVHIPDEIEDSSDESGDES